MVAHEESQRDGVRLIRRPIVGLALAFIAGTWLGLHSAPDLLMLGGLNIILLAVVCILFLFKKRRNPNEQCGAPNSAHFARTCCLHILFFTAAWLNSALNSTSNSNRLPATFLDNKVEMIGAITDEPLRVTYGKGWQVWKFPFAVEGIRRSAGEPWQHTDATVRLRWAPGRNRAVPRYGDRWVFPCKVSELSSKIANGARPILVAEARGGKFVSSGNGSAFVGKCLEMRASMARLFAAGIEDFPNAVAILNSLLLGYRSQMPSDIYRAFAATGTLHIFAISGSHVVVLAAIIIFVLGACSVPRTYWVLFVGPLLILYTVMTGLQPSAMRACIMAIVYWTAPLIRRRSDIYASLAVTAVLILAVVPDDIENIGFVLSFAVVLGIALIYPIVARPLTRFAEPDPLRLQPESRVATVLRVIWKDLNTLVSTSVAAWLVSTPLTAYYFNIFSPIALLGNLVAIPLASLIIVTGSLSFLLGSCVGVLADIFNHANLALVSLMSWSIKTFAALPGAYCQTYTPSLWYLLVFYTLMALWAAHFTLRRKEQA